MMEKNISHGMSVSDIAEKHKTSIKAIELQIEKGIKVEKEHTDSEAEAKTIAMDHLVEIPDYYDRLLAMEKEATKELQEKKKKKATARDYNAKAMWGRVKKQVFKAKKGKGSYVRKGKNKGMYESKVLTEGASNFSTMEHFPLLVWLDWEQKVNEWMDEARQFVEEEYADSFNDMAEDEIEQLVQEKFEEISDQSSKDVAVLSEEEFYDLESDKDEFNIKFRNTFDYEGDVVTIEAGYYEGMQLLVSDEEYFKDEDKAMIEEFLYTMKEKYYLTELGGRGSSGMGYTNLGSGKGLNQIELDVEEKEDLEEELVPPSKEVVDSFLELLKTNGYNIESIRPDYKELSPEGDVHIQIKSKENKFTEENFEQEYERISDLIDALDPQRKYHITYSFGLMDNGYATAGLDIRRWWWDESDVVSLSGEKSIDLTEAKIQGETIEQFMERIKNITGKEPTKVIEAVTTLTEAKVDIDRFVAWGGQELYDRFVKLKPRLKTPENDVTYWTSTKNPRKPEELEQKLVELEGTKTKSQLDSEAREGAELIAENDSFLVYHIKNFEASKKYGKNTTWCVAGSKQWVRNDMQPNQYWDRYTQDQNVKFYYFIRKDNTDKYAFTMYPSGSRQVFNAKNHTLNRGELSKELANAPYVPNVFTPPGYRQKKNLPKLKNARQIGYTFTSLEDYVVSGDLAIEFRRKTKGTAIIPQEIKGIEDLCFAGKPELTEVLIHKGVDYIGVFAFAGCKNLTINCELANKPAGWEDEWNPDGCTVVWGYKPEGKEEEPEDDIQDVSIVARI